MKRSTTLLATAGAILLGTVAALQATAAPALAVAAPPALTTAQVPGSVAYLRAAYGISEREALRRLDLQRMNPLINKALAARYPDSFAGSSLDQANGGVLVIHATDPATIGQAVRGVRDAAHLRVVRAKYSLRELSGVAERIDKQLNRHGAKDRLAEATVDVDANVVDVYQHQGENSGVVETASQLTRIEGAAPVAVRGDVRAAVSGFGDRTVVRQMARGHNLMKILHGLPHASLVNTDSCEPEYCAYPMRGGMRLDVNRNATEPTYPSTDTLNGNWGECTNGFNVVDNRGWSFIMTAGHCTVGPYKSGNTRTYSSYETGRIPVGYELGNWENAYVNGDSAYPVDFAIQPYYTSGSTNYVNYWLNSGGARNLVNSYCWSAEGTQPCTEGNFGITGYYPFVNIGNGWVVCGTGSGDANPADGYHANIGYYNGTRCGQVTSTGDGGIRTNLCMREGDSGGPLFSEIDSMAYGVLTDGTDGSGECPESPPGTEYSRYTPLSKAFDLAYAQTGYTFNVRTSA